MATVSAIKYQENSSPVTLLARLPACTVSGRDDVIVEKFHQVYFHARGQRSADAMKLCR